MYDGGWKPYVRVADRCRRAAKEAARRSKAGQNVSPVVIAGRTIARTFWGKAWCDNLERYSDFSNRLPRGRTYVRNGSVIDLQVEPGAVKALVSGSSLYRVEVKVAAVPKSLWSAVCADCAGAIDSLVELLQGRFSKGVMERICRQKTGLFPVPSEIVFKCSCPDWASMCKHVAAVLYGIGARLDEMPEMLFALRQVNHHDLIAQAGKGLPQSRKGPAGKKVLESEDLSEIFGIELDEAEKPPDARALAGSAARREAKPANAAAPSKTVKPAVPKKSARPPRKRSTGSTKD